MLSLLLSASSWTKRRVRIPRVSSGQLPSNADPRARCSCAGWLQSALAFPVVLSSWMYADIPATNVLAPDRIRVLAALGDDTMISRLLLAKTAVLWVFVAPLCAVLGLVVALDHHDPLLIGTEIIAICVAPVACLPVAALVGIRWPYHPLQLRYRWDHRVPLRRMIIRWLILLAVPYVLVPACAC